jgi:hypothetical protein
VKEGIMRGLVSALLSAALAVDAVLAGAVDVDFNPKAEFCALPNVGVAPGA